jgi:hypothetical protein
MLTIFLEVMAEQKAVANVSICIMTPSPPTMAPNREPASPTISKAPAPCCALPTPGRLKQSACEFAMRSRALYAHSRKRNQSLCRNPGAVSAHCVRLSTRAHRDLRPQAPR